MSYKETLKLIKDRSEKEFNGIPTTFKTLKKVLPTWDHHDSIILTSSTGVGKTSFIWKHAVMDVIETLKSHPSIDGHIYYFSLELTKHELYIKLFSGMLKEKFNREFTRDYLMGYEDQKVTKEELDFLEVESNKLLDFIDKKVTIIDTATTPNKVFMYLADKISDEIDPNRFNFVVIDTVNAFTADSGENKQESIKKWNQDYALKVFRNQKGCVVINISQQDKTSSARQFNFKGESVEEKYIPTLEGLANDKEQTNSARLVISLFNPKTFGIKEWGIGGRDTTKYSVNKFLGNLRFLYVLKNNFGDNTLVIPYYFDGSSNNWIEIEESPTDFRTNPTLYDKYTKGMKNLLLFT